MSAKKQQGVGRSPDFTVTVPEIPPYVRPAFIGLRLLRGKPGPFPLKVGELVTVGSSSRVWHLVEIVPSGNKKVPATGIAVSDGESVTVPINQMFRYRGTKTAADVRK